VSKGGLLIELIGSIDEASAALGLARAFAVDRKSKAVLLEAQRDLYHIMAEVSATPENAARFRKIDRSRVDWLETQTDLVAETVNLPSEFIVPGDTEAGAAMSIARTAVRRAERRLVRALENGEIQNQQLLPYLNRLSSLCFALELFEIQAAGLSEITIAKRGP